nr:type II secretion system protein [Oscillospiraceae bacterium]
MKKQNRKAFTIVELVIVIAVIGILAAVLIPTFAGIIGNANKSADQSVAATLTTQLRLHSIDGEITDEAGLVKVLAKVDPDGTKLVPKALGDGYHFWFEMETQTIIVDKIENIPAPMARIAGTANTSFRDIKGSGYYLIDAGVLSAEFSTADIKYDVFSFIDELATASDYTRLFTTLSAVADAHNYKDIADLVLAKLATTTIRTEAGAFFTANANREYISASATFLGATFHKYADNRTTLVESDEVPVPSGEFGIPSNIEYVSEGALDYAEDSNVVILMPSVNSIVNSFSPAATNATIKVGDATYMVGDLNGENTDKLYTTAGEYVADLVVKLPFAEFEIGYNNNGVVNHTGSGEEKIIYVAYRNGTLRLNAVNAENAAQSSNKVQEWSVLPGDYGTVTIDPKTGIVNLETATFVNNVCEITVQAKALNVNDEVRIETAKVVVVKPLTATVTIITTFTDKTIDFAADSHAISLPFNGELTSYQTTVVATYTKDSTSITNPTAPNDVVAILGIKPQLSIDENTYFRCSSQDNKLIYQTTEDSDGNLIGGDQTFVLKVDNYLEASITATMADMSAAIFKTDFHHERTEDRQYYIGSGNVIKLSDLYNIDTSKFTADKDAIINIYDRVGGTGQLYPMYLANNDPDDDVDYNDKLNLTVKVNVDADGKYTLEGDNLVEKDSFNVTANDWENVVLQFDYEDVNTSTDGKTLEAYIEIIPSDGSVSTIVKFSVVKDALNVTDISGLVAKDKDGNIITHTTDIVIQKDISSVTNADKIVLGDKTLYGNGYKITAQNYKSVATGTRDDYFIKVSGGTVDNVYINGPIYPELDYENANHGYDVSGIVAENGSKINNSYIKGFRQPVAADGGYGGSVSITNTTLHAGNYANLQLVTGTLTLEDVTTIQDQNGTENTFGVQDGAWKKTTRKVLGMGIVIEMTALRDDGTAAKKNNPITLKGYLDQFNWVEKGQKATMPTVMGFDMGAVFPYLYETSLFSSMETYVHTVGSGWGAKQYVNMGIICIIVNPEEFDDNLADPYKDAYKFDKDGDGKIDSGYNYSTYIRHNLVIKDERDVAGSAICAKKTLGHLYMPTFNYKKATLETGLNYIFEGMLRLIGLNLNELDGQINLITYVNNQESYTIGTTTGYPLDYSGYYTNYGN